MSFCRCVKVTLRAKVTHCVTDTHPSICIYILKLLDLVNRKKTLTKHGASVFSECFSFTLRKFTKVLIKKCTFFLTFKFLLHNLVGTNLFYYPTFIFVIF